MEERRPCRGWVPDRRSSRGGSTRRPRQTGEKALSIVATDCNQAPKRTEAVRTVQLPAASPVRYTYDADGNGNVAALVDQSSGTVKAQSDDSPFGETLKATGPRAIRVPSRREAQPWAQQVWRKAS